MLVRVMTLVTTTSAYWIARHSAPSDPRARWPAPATDSTARPGAGWTTPRPRRGTAACAEHERAAPSGVDDALHELEQAGPSASSAAMVRRARRSACWRRRSPARRRHTVREASAASLRGIATLTLGSRPRQARGRSPRTPRAAAAGQGTASPRGPTARRGAFWITGDRERATGDPQTPREVVEDRPRGLVALHVAGEVRVGLEKACSRRWRACGRRTGSASSPGGRQR